MLTAFALSFSANGQDDCPGNWLSINGNQLIDSSGNEVFLSGVNWFGFETAMSMFHGLWARDHKSTLQQIKDLGFNSIRVPWHNGMLREGASLGDINQWGPDPYTGVQPMNVEESQLSKPIELLDVVVTWCQNNDMKVILDCHSRDPDGYLAEGLWYTTSTSEEQWIEDWVFMAERYKDYDAVIAMDINNEPHGKIDDPNGARWGNGDLATDWRLAAEACGNAILAVNPNVLIMVEGIEAYTKPDGTETSYWWGGNLQGARDFPVRLNDPNKLMYSPHEYGPTVFAQEWFDVPEFPENMPAIWEEQFNFLNTNGTSPLFVGELGIKTKGGKDEIWFSKFIDYIKEQKLHYTFWALNPNSGDTGGILDNDWGTVVQWKMDYLQPILYDPIPNCSAVLSVANNESIDPAIKVYPNPTSDFLHFTSSSKNIESITISDINGRIISSTQMNAVAVDSYDLDISKLASGLYVAQIKTENLQQISTIKILKN